MDDRRFFSKIGMSYFVMALLTTGIQIVVSLILAVAAPEWTDLAIVNWLVSLIPFYLIAIPVCFKMLRSLPAMQLYQSKLKPGRWFRILCISIFIMYVGNIIGNIVCALITRATGLDLTLGLDSLMTGGSVWYNLLFTVILAPIMEELIFRKALVDRAIVYGDKATVLLSGLMFGLFHGNFHQFFYAFGLGCVLAYVYIRTGKLRYSIALHMSVNFLGGFLSSWLLQKIDYASWLSQNPYDSIDLVFNHMGPLLALILLEIGMIGLAIAGLVFFIMSVKKLEWRSGEYEKPTGKMASVMFGNPGMLLFFAICGGLFIMSML